MYVLKSNMIMVKLHRFSRVRALHTIISQETIKPYSPTPYHLKTYNLSILDHIAPNFLMPKVFFYKNYNYSHTKNLKQSLSKSLTQYYPFAGRFPTPMASYIDCNDEGIKFVETSNSSRISDFIHNKNQDETFDQLISHGLGSTHSQTSPTNLLEVQVNHFTSGGVALAVSISHKIADGFTAANFINHWATVTRCESPVNPFFISSSESSDVINVPVVMNKGTIKSNYIARKFVFPNKNLKELKKKVNAMGANPLNPTRVEILTSLLFKCAMGATTANSGYLNPYNLLHTVNMRNQILKSCPETRAGNIMTMVMAKIACSGEIMLNEVISELRKAKMELEEVRGVEEVGKHYMNTLAMLEGDQSRSFVSSSLCRFPFYNVDFGWGKPIKVATRYPDVDDNGVIMLDTPSRDGIEALVHLKKEEMAIFEMVKELLLYVENE